MESYVYSNAISIHGVKGAQISNAAEMPKDEAKRFIHTVKDALKRLDKLRTGRRLIREINDSGHTCRIFCAPDGNEGAANSDPQTLESNARRMIKSFRPQQYNMLPASKKFNFGDGGKKVLGEIKESLKAANLHQDRYTASTELDYILVRAWRNLDTGRNAVARLLNKPRNMIDQMCDGQAKIDDDDYFRIAFAYYEFLTPGPGCNTQVKLKAEVKLTSSGTYKPKTNVAAVAPEIIVGHELIHAWRMMKGMRVVDHGWEEEAMTTGIAPFAHLPVTENALRLEGGYPRRDAYPPTSMSTSFGAELSF